MRQNFSNTADDFSDFESNRLTTLSNRLHEIECDADKQYEDITTLVEKNILKFRNCLMIRLMN